MPGGPHPIPSRTRSLSPPGSMVLRLKAWESRSLPALRAAWKFRSKPSFTHAIWIDAGWSSPVARQAHNLKVVGSNPAPAPIPPDQHGLAGNSGAVLLRGVVPMVRHVHPHPPPLGSSVDKIHLAETPTAHSNWPWINHRRWIAHTWGGQFTSRDALKNGADHGGLGAGNDVDQGDRHDGRRP